MDRGPGWAGGRGHGRRLARAGAYATAFSLTAALLTAAPAGAAATGGGSTAAPGGTPGESQVAKICAEPSSGAVLTTGSHRAPAAAPAAAIRVDQVGYPSGAAKLAEIMTKAKPHEDLPGGGVRWWAARWWRRWWTVRWWTAPCLDCPVLDCTGWWSGPGPARWPPPVRPARISGRGARATAGCGPPGSPGSGRRAGTGSGSWATRRRPRPGSRSARPRSSTPGRWPTRCISTRTSAMARTSSTPRCAARPAT